MMSSYAIMIRVIKIGATAYTWELRDPNGALVTDAGRDGSYGCFAAARDAFDDATRVATARPFSFT